MGEYDGHNTRQAHVLMAACRYALSQAETHGFFEDDIVLEIVLEWDNLSPVDRVMILADIEAAERDTPCLPNVWKKIARLGVYDDET